MQVDDSATVGDLKNQIRQTLGLTRPRLVYNGGLLDDQKTLHSYQIPNNSCIIVQEMYSIVCWVSDTINGVTLTAPYNLVVHRHNTFADLKYLLHKAYGIDMTDRKFYPKVEIPSFEPPDLCPLHLLKTMHIIKIVYINAKEYNMIVGDDETVLGVKNRIFSSFGRELPVEKQQLEFNGVEMQDENTMQCYPIDNYDRILVREKFGISVLRPLNPTSGQSNERYGLIVHKDYTVGDLKLMLQRQFGFDITSIRLTLPNLLGNYLMDDVKIGDYDISAGSTVISTMQVRLEIDGVFSMEVEDNATVEDLKNRIRQALGLPFPQLQLNGVILQSNSTLRSYQIPSHSRIIVLDMYFITCMVARTKIGITFDLPYTLFVHKGNTFRDLRHAFLQTMQVKISFNDKELEVEVEENATVLGLKHRLHDKFSLQPLAQELEFDGFILQNHGKTLRSYHIGNNAKIVLRELFGISIHVVKQDKDGEPDPQFPISVHKENTIGFLKEMLSIKYGVEFTHMKLGLSSMWHNNLHDSTKIGAYNLRDRSILYAFEM
ncbi:hypothetical protein NC652_010282 [Populus alba x Populus x berolinensis]|nr:hypothetical protein NC652_010282 [Populus alba x Populus x berolinensis]